MIILILLSRKLFIVLGAIKTSKTLLARTPHFVIYLPLWPPLSAPLSGQSCRVFHHVCILCHF